jgi:hypothetical protein
LRFSRPITMTARASTAGQCDCAVVRRKNVSEYRPNGTLAAILCFGGFGKPLFDSYLSNMHDYTALGRYFRSFGRVVLRILR